MTARILCVLSAYAALTAVASPAAAQAPTAPPGRFAVSATLGVSMPVDSAMSDVYGHGLMPIAAQVDLRLKTPIWLFGGVRYLGADGQTVIVGTKVADESSPTSFRMTSVRLGAQVATRLASRWALAAGAGVSLAWYEETWPEAGQSVSDRAPGVLALAEARYAIAARWAAVARVEYTTVPRTNTPSGTNVNLGGVDISAGVRVLF